MFWKRKRPENGHCWHKTEKHETTQRMVCCYCNLEFDPYDMIAPPEHGEFAPKTWYPSPPEVCPKRGQ